MSASGPCEIIQIGDWGPILGHRKCCDNPSIVINSTDFLITSTRDESVEGFGAWYNRKIEYLPSNLGETYPNLVGMQFGHCSIKAITKKNFKFLNKLRQLLLRDNQIGVIADDTFDYIPVVETIHLGE